MRRLIAAALLLAMPSIAIADDAKDAAFVAFMKAYDRDGDGLISDDERQRLNCDLAIASKRLAAKNAGAKPPPATAQSVPPLPRPDSDIHSVVLLRDLYTTKPYLVGGSDLSGNGASLSFTSDRIARTNIVAGQGALLWALYGDTNLNRVGDRPNAALTHFTFLPGVEWDIKSKNGRSSGSYSARVGAEFEFVGLPFFSTQYLGTNAIYTTDVATSRADLFSIETQWTPYALLYGIGTGRRVIPALDMYLRISPTGDVDYLRTGDTATFVNLMTNHDYLWVGHKSKAELYFLSGALMPLTLFAKHVYLYDALNGQRSTVNYVEAGAAWQLVQWDASLPAQQRASVALEVKYRNGKTPRTLDRLNDVFAGLTARIGDLPGL